MAARRNANTTAAPAAASGSAGGSPAAESLDRLAWLLDSSIRLPGGFRIGIDGLIGLIPGLGDAAGALLGLYIVLRASAFDVPRAVLARMLLNVGIETVIGAIPVFGDLFDFAFKANQRNVALLRRYSAAPRRERRSAWALLAAVAALVIVAAIVVVAAGVALAQWLLAAV